MCHCCLRSLHCAIHLVSDIFLPTGGRFNVWRSSYLCFFSCLTSIILVFQISLKVGQGPNILCTEFVLLQIWTQITNKEQLLWKSKGSPEKTLPLGEYRGCSDYPEGSNPNWQCEETVEFLQCSMGTLNIPLLLQDGLNAFSNDIRGNNLVKCHFPSSNNLGVQIFQRFWKKSII